MADTDAWDADDFEPELPQNKAVSDRWEGEDEDDNIKDTWEDVEDEEKKEEEGKSAESQAYQRPKKKPLAERLAEKEALKKKEEEEIKAKQKEEQKDLTPEEKIKEKIRLQKIQEQADLSLAKGLFGIQESSIDKIVPTTEEEFVHFEEILKAKITFFEDSKFYPAFVEKLFLDLALGLSVDDVKKISSNLNNLYHEKERQRKEQDRKKKTKKTKATIKMDRADDLDLIGDATGGGGYNFEDEDDFL